MGLYNALMGYASEFTVAKVATAFQSIIKDHNNKEVYSVVSNSVLG